MSKIVSAPLHSTRLISFISVLLLSLFAAVPGARAQSLDIEQPTPVTSTEITGRIAARDIGDSRLTKHFYVLTGVPGDLVISVDSRNLDGDIDLFQAGTLRPLAKVGMYATELSTGTSKSIYLRQRETIILRVEARTPNDNEGTYRVRFGGAFEAMAAPPASERTEDLATAEPTPTPSRPGTKRVNAVGARIDEPEQPETARTTQPETSAERPEASNRPAATASTETTTTPEAVTTTGPQSTPSTRGRRRRRGQRTTTPPAAPAESTTQNTPARTDAGDPAPTVTEPTAEAGGPKLIIETRDGMRIERYMSTVRRVTVERGQIVVIATDGKVTRHTMTNVLRMTIEP